MRTVVILFFLMFSSCSQKVKSVDCERFKTGKFSYKGYLIERNDSVQTEKIGKGIILTKRIKWINDCEYELTFLSGRQKDTLPDGGIRVYEAKERVKRIKIIETAGDYYVFETPTNKGKNNRDTVWLLSIGGLKSLEDTFPQQ